jgi:hypothetical protein
MPGLNFGLLKASARAWKRVLHAVVVLHSSLPNYTTVAGKMFEL